MKLLHAWQIYSKVFCEEVYVVVFFKVVQQQAIGEVGNSTMCLWADAVTHVLSVFRVCKVP